MSAAEVLDRPAASKPAAPAPASPGARFDRIDSLRALAMTAVIAQHCKILPFGWMGVWLFFVISGFVVTTSLLARPEPRAGVLLGRFYARRAARIWPIYLAYVLAGFVVSGLTIGRFAWPAFASLVFFYNNFQSAFAHGTFPGFPVGHLWTISVEFQFYIVFGLAFAFLSRRALAGLLLAFLIAAPLLRLAGGAWLEAQGLPRGADAFAIYTFSPMHFDSFAAGALLALARASWTQPGRARTLLAAGVLAMGAYAAAYAAINQAHGAAGLAVLRNIVSGVVFADRREVWLYSAVAALSAGVLAATLAGEAVLAPIGDSRLLQSVGRVSYGGYVYHAWCVRLVEGPLHRLLHPGAGMVGKLAFGAAHFAAALPLTLALAFLSHRWVEQPIIGAVNRRLAAADRQAAA